MIYKNFFKPMFDIIFSFILIILFLPIMIVVGVLVLIFLGRPIFFTQKRPGLGGKIFTIYKFRTMNNLKDKNGNLLDDSKRLNKIGKMIRQTSLDELPQLFNVIKLDMSFIGPRPLLCEYLELYNDEQKKRHSVTPGITGWAQINGRNAISWDEKFKLDVWYVKHQSFMLDVKILLLSVKKVLKKDGINSSTSVSMEKFNGNN